MAAGSLPSEFSVFAECSHFLARTLLVRHVQFANAELTMRSNVLALTMIGTGTMPPESKDEVFLAAKVPKEAAANQLSLNDVDDAELLVSGCSVKLLTKSSCCALHYGIIF